MPNMFDPFKAPTVFINKPYPSNWPWSDAVNEPDILWQALNRGYDFTYPLTGTGISRIVEAIREVKLALNFCISVRAVFADDVEDGDIVTPNLAEDPTNGTTDEYLKALAAAGLLPDSIWVPVNRESYDSTVAVPSLLGVAYKEAGRVVFGPIVTHKKFVSFRTGDTVYAAQGGDVTTDSTLGFAVATCVAPGALNIVSSSTESLEATLESLLTKFNELDGRVLLLETEVTNIDGRVTVLENTSGSSTELTELEGKVDTNEANITSIKEQMITDIEATVDSTTGTPSVTTTISNGVATLKFSGLKGEKGEKGATGSTGSSGGTASVTSAAVLSAVQGMTGTQRKSYHTALVNTGNGLVTDSSGYLKFDLTRLSSSVDSYAGYMARMALGYGIVVSDYLNVYVDSATGSDSHSSSALRGSSSAPFATLTGAYSYVIKNYIFQKGAKAMFYVKSASNSNTVYAGISEPKINMDILGWGNTVSGASYGGAPLIRFSGTDAGLRIAGVSVGLKNVVAKCKATTVGVAGIIGVYVREGTLTVEGCNVGLETSVSSTSEAHVIVINNNSHCYFSSTTSSFSNDTNKTLTEFVWVNTSSGVYFNVPVCFLSGGGSNCPFVTCWANSLMYSDAQSGSVASYTGKKVNLQYGSVALVRPDYVPGSGYTAGTGSNYYTF